MSRDQGPRVGVLALQGDFREHGVILKAIGALPVFVRTPGELDLVEALIVPGGESTTIGKLATRFGLIDPLVARIEAGMPTWGTCAGMILLAKDVVGPDQPLLRCLDIVVERNAFGRQNDSFETDLDIEGLDEPFHAVFIRSPWVVKVGDGVDVLASIEGHPVMVQSQQVMATSFHPELTGDSRLHQRLVDLVE
ncbi:MAG: pyridoxal 5'-phosphate synthase glutaminase subunit PdxT [Actinobacteria bacterium]|nr:pyridoxal 5'-phosphate synthase glutaminase subunit PdxT [Actinomycetota bacterium]